MAHMPTPGIPPGLAALTAFSIRDYGAVGDGVTDDTAAIQAAIDAAQVAGAVDRKNIVVYVPASTHAYMFSNLKLAAYTVLLGTRIDQCVLRRLPGSTGPAIREKTAAEGNVEGARSIWIRDLGLDGNGTAGDGFYLGYQNPGKLFETWAGMQNVMAFGFPSGAGFHLQANAIELHYIYGINNQDGVWFEGGAGNTVFAVYGEFNTRYQFRAKTVGSMFVATQLEADSSSGTNPIMLVEGGAQSFDGVYISHQNAKPKVIEIAAGTTKTNLRDVFIDPANGGTWTNGIYVDDYGYGTASTVSRISAFIAGEATGVESHYINMSNGKHDIVAGDSHYMGGTLQVDGGAVLQAALQVTVASGAGAIVPGTVSKSWSLYPLGNDLRVFEFNTTFGAGGGNDRAAFIAGGGLQSFGNFRATVASGSGAFIPETSSKSWSIYPSGNDLKLFEYATTFLAGGGNDRVTFKAGGAVVFGGTVQINATGPMWTSNAGTPEAAVVGSPGDLCSDTTNGELYIKKSGSATNTGWKLMTHA